MIEQKYNEKGRFTAWYLDHRAFKIASGSATVHPSYQFFSVKLVKRK